MASHRRREIAGTDGAEDIGLLARVRARDLKAFEQLYRLHHVRLSRFVAAILHRQMLVEEVVNDTMMVLWDKPDSFGGRSKLSTWLFAIAYRKAHRARLREDGPPDPPFDAMPDAVPPDGRFAQARSAAMLRIAIDELSPEHRAVVHLTYFQDISYREIADIMDCPVDTVKTRMFHARRHLKSKLAGDLADWI